MKQCTVATPRLPLLASLHRSIENAFRSRENVPARAISHSDMKVQAPFGFVTGCHAGDKFIVQATLASMRHYCPDVPICLTVDGDFDVSDLGNNTI